MFYCVFDLQFYRNHFWTVAIAGQDANTDNSVATEILFGKSNKTAIEADFDNQKKGYVTFY